MYTCVVEKEATKVTLFTFLFHAVFLLIIVFYVDDLLSCRRPVSVDDLLSSVLYLDGCQVQ